jgi:citrate lyase subunit beta/citryl-CoA lyase
MTPAADRTRIPRSLLFVPGSRADMIAKVGRCAPDAAVIDLEDAVPADGKAAARATAAAAARGAAGRVPLFLRVNGAQTPWFGDDVAAAAGGPFAGVVLPKLETAAAAERLAQLLGSAGRRDLVIIGGLETARGIAQCEQLAVAPLDGVYFGAEDYIADLGGRRSASGLEALYARSRVVLAARLSGLHPIDQAVMEPRETARFEADASAGRDLGYRGKICIHPSQVAAAHHVFTPSASEVGRARAVLGAIAAAGAAGVAVVDGQMVDAVHARAAAAVLRSAGEA